MFKLLQNDAHASLYAAAVCVVLVLVLSRVGVRLEWLWYVFMLIPVYGIVRSVQGLVKRNYLSLVGIIVNLMLMGLLFFIIALSGANVGPG